MQTNILRKCLEELNKPEPNISYLKGMLETIVEMSGSVISPANGLVSVGQTSLNNPIYTTTAKVDEVDEALYKYNNGKIGRMS